MTNHTFETWQQASDQWADARRAMKDAETALKAATLAYYEAEEALAKEESRPGQPLYLDTAQA
jgi:hypothetical protein